MTRTISYWLVLNVREYLMSGGKREYACLNEKGESATTDNPKKALRFHTEEGAQAQAYVLGWHWTAVQVNFNGDELCL